MKKRLLASYLVLVLAVLVVLEVPLGALVANHDYSVLAAQAQQEDTGLAIVVGEDLEHDQPTQVRSLVLQYRGRTGGEVTVYGSQSRVVAAAGTDHDHDARPDAGKLVSRALAGHAGSSFTFDEGRPVAEAAVPLSADARPSGVVLLDLPAGAAVTSAHEAWLVLALFGAGVLGASAIVAVVLARSFAQPLAELETSVDRLAGGDLSARSSARGPEEIRTLAEGFNRMAQQLEELVGSQSRFVADASHQLRSPLTALRLRLENIEAEVGGQAVAGVAAAGDEVQRLSRIVDGLLALTQAEREHPDPTLVDIARTVDERCRAWAPLADEKSIDLSARLPSGSGAVSLEAYWVPGDLDQILDNLLANAFDACPGGSRVTVRLVPEGLTLVDVHVTDDGPGLSADERGRAFERFWQAPGKTRRGGGSSRPGGGLGLAIVRELAARNGAEVELREATGGGLDAVVRFSLAVPAPGSKVGH